jgi:hypothetical protein
MDDRSERLRKRRKQSTGRSNRRTRSGEATDTDSSKPSEPAESTESDGAESPDETADGAADERDDEAAGQPTSIKEKQTGTYMYLPDSQTKELRRLYNVLKAEYEFEYDEEFEKNRHFYPLVVQYGLERLDGMDAAEIRTRLESEFA